MRKLATKLTAVLIKHEIIPPEEEEIYSYGLKLILSSGFTTIVLLGTGIWLQQIALTILFIVAFVALRSYVGGYHANSYSACFIISCLCYLLCLISVHLGTKYMSLVSAFIISIIAHCILFYEGSLNSKKNPKTKEEMAKRKLYVRVLSSIYCIISLFILLIGQQLAQYAWLLIYIQTICALGIIVEKLKRGKKK